MHLIRKTISIIVVFIAVTNATRANILFYRIFIPIWNVFHKIV